MATAKTDILSAVQDLYPGGVPSDLQESLDGLLQKALRIYSADKPFEDVVDVTGEGANLMSTPTGWVDGASRVTRFSYPYEDEDSAQYENISDYLVIERVPVSGSPVEKIRFLALSPAATETVRVWFSRPHAVSDTACTVYAQDTYALASLVASMIESARASRFLGLKDNGVATDLVDYGQKAAEARALAAKHRQDYLSGIGINTSAETAPAAVASEMDTDPQYGRPSHMTHHGRNRR